MKVVILCGGMGIRAFPFTEYLPKPMLPVMGSPILVHIIKSFIRQGFDDFVLAAGHRKNVLEDYFEHKDLGASIQIVDTGDESDTGKRIRACESLVGDRFIATYGDGLADVPMAKVLAFHEKHGKLATVTGYPLFTQYGVLDADQAGQVVEMREKPILPEHWINIGFMVFEKGVFEHWAGDNLERDVLPRLTEVQELFMYRHEGFFKSLDSYKDQQDFEAIVSKKNLPWKVET